MLALAPAVPPALFWGSRPADCHMPVLHCQTCLTCQTRYESPTSPSGPLSLQLLAVVGRYLADPGEGVAAAGVRGAAAVVDALAPVLDAAGWAAVVEALLDAVEDDPLAALAPDTSGTATSPHPENSFTGPIMCKSNMLFLASACCSEFETGGEPLSELASPLPGSFQIFSYQETGRIDKRARTRTHTNDVQITDSLSPASVCWSDAQAESALTTEA